MTPSGDRTAADIKLRELQRQRDRLDEHYTAVATRAAAAATPLERLRILYHGLRQTTFAQKQIHPEVANLDGLFFQGAVGEVPADLIDTWLVRLERELAQGRLRGELAHAFGRILDEPTPPAPEPLPAGLEDTAEPAAADLRFLDPMLAAWGQTLTTASSQIRQTAEQSRKAVTDDEVRTLLRTLSRDANRPAEVQRRAGAALTNPTQVHEYAGVLTIVLENLAEWDWPAEGVTRRTVLLRDRPRVFLDDDLVTALLWQLLGMRWGLGVHQVLANAIASYQGGILTPKAAYDYSSIDYQRHAQCNNLFLPMIPRNQQEWVRTGGYGRNVLEDQLRLVRADIRVHQAKSPKKPLVVVQTDIKDFYPRLSHYLLLGLLGRLGAPDGWLDIIRRYLGVRVRSADGDRVVRRGIPLDYCFSDLLAEMLLLVMDVHVYQQTGVRLARVVDDIFYLCPDVETAQRVWQSLETFLAHCGLSLNLEKSGSLLLGSGPVPGLPQALPRWGALELHPDGRWRVNEPAFARLEDWVGRHTRDGGSTLGMVRRYNDAVRFLVGCLGLTVDLGPEHYLEVGRRLSRLQHNLFGPDHGIAAEMRRRLQQHFRDPRLQQHGVPEALLYWPVTAGGLGLVQPLLMVAAYGKNAAVPKWSSTAQDPRATTYYGSLLRPRPMVSPEKTPAFDNLVKDFIARGTEVAGQKQVTLRPYWQWTLTTYGPALLEAVGTFRFLPTELVPLSLVMRYGGGGSGEEMEQTDDDIPF